MERSGRVTDAEGDLFTAILTPDGGGIELIADFSMAQCGIEVEPGDLITVTPEAVVKVPPRSWNQHEIDEIMARAKNQSARLQAIAGKA